MNSTVQAAPTKRFFVEMLTRDIELEDAVLDLLDNCLDGALRAASERTEPRKKKYEGFFAEITVNGSHFMIRDNCGGIPLAIAQNYAFRMGRGKSDSRDLNLETVGMYGIGMKRAFFKIGKETLVTSCHADAKFSVHIPTNWLEDDDNWTFELTEEERDEHDVPGTEILIEQLVPGIATMFSDPQFDVGLRNRISEHYSAVLDGGFRIVVNDEEVTPTITRILFSEEGPKPYMLKWQYQSVEVFMAVGLNAPAITTDEDSPTDNTSGPLSRRRSYDDGGWTIFCNDRAILVRDKSRVTGWGERVPAYHWQFAVISGIVEFRAKNAADLPVTTTKRNMDTSHELFLLVRNEMINGLKIFTDYTNAWRHDKREKQDVFFEETVPLDVAELKRAFNSMPGKSSKRRGDLHGAEFHNPQSDLPTPPSKTPTTRKIIFTREIQEIKEVAEYLFGDPTQPPKEVGSACFERTLKSSRRKK